MEFMDFSPYSVSLFSGSYVVCLLAKRSCKTCVPSEIAHTGLHAHKNKEWVHMLKSCVCVLTLLPLDNETEYSYKTVETDSALIYQNTRSKAYRYFVQY